MKLNIFIYLIFILLYSCYNGPQSVIINVVPHQIPANPSFSVITNSDPSFAHKLEQSLLSMGIKTVAARQSQLTGTKRTMADASKEATKIEISEGEYSVNADYVLYFTDHNRTVLMKVTDRQIVSSFIIPYKNQRSSDLYMYSLMKAMGLRVQSLQ